MNDATNPTTAPEGAAPAGGTEDGDKTKTLVVDYSISRGLVGLLAKLNIALAITSYQSGRLYLLGRNPKGGLMINEQHFRRAMGMFYEDQTLYLAAQANIYRMENILRPGQVMDSQFTTCFVPRASHLIGAVNPHDVGVTKDDEILFVNTRYNCLAKVSRTHSFEPYWKPSFISEIVAEDRCHLNGMAMQDGVARYVSAVSTTDTDNGWRDHRRDGGVIIDLATDEIVCEGLSMPHTPKLFDDKLWLMNSGTGELGWVDFSKPDLSKRFTPVCFCPGFTRGLAFAGKYAFVGLSKPRHGHFDGLALGEILSEADLEPWCGMQVVDLETGTCVEWFRIQGDISEIYGVEALPELLCPRSYGFATNDVLSIVTLEDHELT